MPPSLAACSASRLTRAWLWAVTIRSVSGAISEAVTSLGLACTITSMPAALAAPTSRSSASWTTTLAMSIPRSRSMLRVVTPKWREPTRVIRMVQSVPVQSDMSIARLPTMSPCGNNRVGVINKRGSLGIADAGRLEIRRASRCRSGVLLSRRQHLVDAPSVHVDDLEAPVANPDLVADLGDGGEFLQQIAGEGLIGPRWRQRDAKQVGEFQRGHPAGNQIGAVVALDISGLGGAVLALEGADDGFENVGAGDDALEHAILVVHEADMDGRVAQDCDHVARIEGFGNDRRLARQRADIRRFAGEIDIEQILGLHDAERAVAIAVEHDAARMIGLLQICEDDGQGIGEIDLAHLVARRHHGTDREIAEPHY